jgi:acyl-CoA reductase-like NAD-dependent aldehyde dehydrogenase
MTTGGSVWLHRNPCDWSVVLGEVPLARGHEVDAAFERVAQRLSAWQAVRPVERVERLRGLIARLRARVAEWTEILIREVGKPRIDAEGEFSYGMSLLEAVCTRYEQDASANSDHVRFRPHGVVGLITPWNNPLAIPLGKLVPALIYGNGVLWKPALPAYGLSQVVVDELTHAGLGEAVAVVGGDAETGRLLLDRPGLAAASFTGSVEIGQAIVHRCQERGIAVQAELGGNNAAIVMADIDVDAVAKDLAPAMFSFSGQRCTAIRRLIVDRGIAGPFREAIHRAIEILRVGFPADHQTQIGPVISRERQQELLQIITSAEADGGELLVGGCIPGGVPAEGCWLAPTLIAFADQSKTVMRQELFGPVAGLILADGLDHALLLHNATQYGLLGALFSRDPTCQARFVNEAEAGILSINQARPAFAASGPFVGWKSSGHGPPEHGRWNREFYTRPQAVYGG